MLSVIISPLLGSAMTCKAVLQTKSEHHEIDARSTDRRKKPNEKTPHIAGTTGGKQTCETDDPEEFSSFLDSFLCRKKMLREKSSSAPPVKSTTTGGHRKRPVSIRARTEERKTRSSNQSSSHSKQWVFWSPISSKEAEKKSCESRELTSADRPWLEQRAKLLWREKSLHDKNDGAETGDGGRRKTTLRDKTTATKKKKLRKKAFLANFFSFSFPRKKELHPRRKIYSTSYGGGGGNVGRELRLGTLKYAGACVSLEPKRTQEKYG